MSSRNEMSGLKRLVLGGAVASMGVVSSGCWAALPAGYLYLQSQRQNAQVQADAQIEAARIQADAINSVTERNNPQGRDYDKNTAPEMPDRKISHIEFIEMLRKQGVSREKIAEAELINVAYNPLFGCTFIPICNYGRDLNNNGRIEPPDELFGLNSQLIEGDPILIGMSCEKEQSELTYRLFDSRGNKIDELVEKHTGLSVAYNHSESLKYPESERISRREVKLQSGTYLATLNSGDDLVTTREFTIVPKQQGTVVAEKKNN